MYYKYLGRFIFYDHVLLYLNIMDSDSTIVLIISLLITFLNIVFISSVFIFFCCCIDVIDLSQKKRTNIEKISVDNDVDLELLNNRIINN